MNNEYMNNQYIWGVVNSIIKNPTTKVKCDPEKSEIMYSVETYGIASKDTLFSTRDLYEMVAKSVNGK